MKDYFYESYRIAHFRATQQGLIANGVDRFAIWNNFALCPWTPFPFTIFYYALFKLKPTIHSMESKMNKQIKVQKA